MGFEVALDAGFDPSESIYVNSPGRYHLAVVDVDEDGLRLGGANNKGEMVVDFEVLAGSAPGQEGLRHRTYFTKTVKAAGRLHRIAIAAGLITEDQINKLKEAGKSPLYEFERDLKGKQIFGEIAETEFENKKKLKIEWGMFHLASKGCVDKVRWPRNETMVARSGVKMPDAKPADKKPDSKPAPSPLDDVTL